ncbi:hypothetical protein PHLCEN_2v10377 [Hermanssonia centrifuga]|uniref:Protein MAK16 homolog n=1 Tax=Hermanssonia centrifuga TaxID=98765 RepID=A0A2R6NN66_9APHY|nr:hypothetical protein PHLCEN_2v10377 [Hermanssonia centrifuga]
MDGMFCNDELTIPDTGTLYLYVKTIERAHTPKNMWERIKLSTNYSKALEQKKLDRREATRERKALSAAKLERSIQAELLERLKSKAYGDAPLNVNEDVWRAVLDRERAGQQGMDLEDEESEEEEEEELEEEEEGWGDREFVSDVSGDEDELSDLEDVMSEDEEPSDEDDDAEESGEDDEGDKSKTTLGKRKAPARLSKPPRKKPEKKVRRECALSWFLAGTNRYLQVDRGWKWSTSTRWKACHLQKRQSRVGDSLENMSILIFIYLTNMDCCLPGIRFWLLSMSGNVPCIRAYIERRSQVV